MSIRKSIGKYRSYWAVIACFLSALCFALSNLFLRHLINYHLDNNWTLFFKEFTGVLVLAPWILFCFIQKRYRFLSVRLLSCVILAAIICELIAAKLHLWCYSTIGLAISVPVIQSASVIGSLLLGFFVLRDVVSRKKIVASIILINAIITMALGAQAVPIDQDAKTSLMFLAGILAAIVAGIAYTIEFVLLRYACIQYWRPMRGSGRKNLKAESQHGIDAGKPAAGEKKPLPLLLVVFIFLFVGTLIFGADIYLKYDIEGFWDAPADCWTWVLLAGLFNVIAFILQIQGLRLTSVSQVTFIGVSQVIFLSLSGFFFFGESLNGFLILGLLLTSLGVYMSSTPETENSCDRSS